MEQVGKVITVLKGSGPLMGMGAPLSTSGQGRMPEVPKQRPTPSPPEGLPQKPKDVTVSAAPSEGYVRLKIHVDLENGQMSVIDIHPVPGPLIMPTTVTRGYVYEVLLGGQTIALGSIPDAGVRRSFANRDVPGPEGKHRFIATEPSFDFFARIPKNQISEAMLPQLTIVLHEVQEAPDRFMTSVPLLKMEGTKTVEVGRLVGITPKTLPQTIRSALEQILNESAKPA